MTSAFKEVPAPTESSYTIANNELIGSLDRVQDLVGLLHKRLHPVMHPAANQDGDGAGSASVRPMAAPLIFTLEHHTARANALGDELNDLVQRLCL